MDKTTEYTNIKARHFIIGFVNILNNNQHKIDVFVTLREGWEWPMNMNKRYKTKKTTLKKPTLWEFENIFIF